MTVGAAFVTTVCAGMLVMSAVTFGCAAVLVRRARRAETSAREKYEAAVREREQAQRIHAGCRARPFSVGVVTGPLGPVRVGSA